MLRKIGQLKFVKNRENLLSVFRYGKRICPFVLVVFLGFSGKSLADGEDITPENNCHCHLQKVLGDPTPCQPAGALIPVGTRLANPESRKKISLLRKGCEKNFESVQSFCTEQGLAKIQVLSAVGQTVASAVSIVKANGKPESAKKAMDLSKNVSYGLGALNAGVGAKCLSNIGSCSKSCGQAERTKECLEEVQRELAAAGTAAIPAGSVFLQAARAIPSYVESLSKVEGNKKKCVLLKGNAYAALAQGAAHGASGLIQGEIAKTMGQEAEKEEEFAEAPPPTAPPPVPELPSIPELSNSPSFEEGDGTGAFAGFQGNGGSVAPPSLEEDPEDLFNGNNVGNEDLSDMGYIGSYSGSSPGGNSGRGVAGAMPSPFSGGGGGGGDSAGEGEEDLSGGSDFSSGGGYGSGFQGSSSNHYGSGGGYYSSLAGGRLGKGLKKKPLVKKKAEELQKLKNSIGGKHENIFEKASRIISAYCMEGPIKCE